VAAEAGKVGNLFVVERDTGKLVRKSQAFVEQSSTMFSALSDKPVTIYPANKGGAMWSPPAFSPVTRLFYTLGINEAHDYTSTRVEPYREGSPQVGVQIGGAMKTNTDVFYPNGNLSAIDVDSGRVLWQYRSELPVYGGVLATAGNLVFSGEMTGDFNAFNARSGEKLWSFNLGMGVCTPPITYRVKGVQYIAVGASGCRGGEPYMAKKGLPSYGDAFAIFALDAQ
jgi:glucose dehydrogenase